jgi:transcriptional regulator with XRE-family HTH domain
MHTMAKKRDEDRIELCVRIQREFGMRVQRERKRQGLVQKNLAFRMGLTRVTVSSIERGCQRLFLDQVYVAAHALEVDVHILLPAVGELLSARPIRFVTDDPLPRSAHREAERIITDLTNAKALSQKTTSSSRAKMRR